MDDLLTPLAHDPGGKVRTRMPAGMQGDALFFGDRQEYRTRLRRWSGPGPFPPRYILWIGMNPSTADAEVNDPTIGREWEFTTRIGYQAMIKCNIVDYRATKPTDLLQPQLVLESFGNRAAIIEAAAGAEVVICAWGAVNRALQPIAGSVLAGLALANVQLYCLGRTANGSPRHPLYVKGDTPLEMFA